MNDSNDNEVRAPGSWRNPEPFLDTIADGPTRLWMREYILRMRLMTESCTNPDGTPKPYEPCPELRARLAAVDPEREGA